MNSTGSFGAWIPIWILGAPLVLALVDWARTPKTSTSASWDAPTATRRGDERLGTQPTPGVTR